MLLVDVAGYLKEMALDGDRRLMRHTDKELRCRI